MARSERTFTVDRPLDDVYQYLLDPMHSAVWDATIASITPDPVAPAGWDVLVAFYGKRIPFRLELHDARAGSLIEFRGTSRAAVRRERFEFAADPAGTTVTHLSEVRLTGPLRVLNKGLDSAYEALCLRSARQLIEALTVAAPSR